jgi:hypothetical protein
MRIKTEKKERVSKSERENVQMSCKHKCIRIKADFSTETLKAKEGME